LNFKFNVKMTKILLTLIIITFFLPFLSVSCGPRDAGVNISAFEIATGKTVGEYRQRGEPAGFVLVIPAVILLLCSVYAYDTKRRALYTVYKTALFIAPVFNIFAAFIFRHAAVAAIARKIYNATGYHIGVKTGVKYGFILYVSFSAALFIFAAFNYFLKREEPNNEQSI